MLAQISTIFCIFALGGSLTQAKNVTGTQIPEGTLAQELAFAMLNAVDCQSCLTLLVPLQKLANTGDEPFSKMLIEACLLFGDQPFPLCNGTIGMAAPQFARDLRGITVTHDAEKDGVVSQSRQLLCSVLFGICSFPPAPPADIPLPPLPEHPKKFESKGNKPMKWAHISDVHIDRSYLPGADTNCSVNLCCRDFGPSSVGPGVLHPAQPYGDKHCDSPVPLAMNMIQAIHSLPDINGTIFTGDISEGLDFQYTQKEATDNLIAWYFESQVLNPYHTLGNHDSSPTASMTYHPRHDTDWLYNITRVWEMSIGKEAAEFAASHAGMYAFVHPGTHLKIISLNTIIYYQHDFMNFDQDFPSWDASGQLRWLIDELKKSEDAGERVWIIGHIPSGKADTLVSASHYMDIIFKRFQNTIASKFYGHSHKEQFEIGYSDYNNQTVENALGISFITGAVTPTSGNPNFRVYDVDPDTYEVLDFETIIANFSSPTYQEGPQWTTLYSAREAYGAFVDPPLMPNQPLDGKFFHKLTEAFEKNDTLFQFYNSVLMKGVGVSPCTGACKTKTICEQRAARSEDNCDGNTPGAFFNRRDIDYSQLPPPDPHACGGQGLHTLVRKMIGPVTREKLNTAISKRELSNKWHDAFIDVAMEQLVN